MKILITGNLGQLGSALQAALTQHQITGFDLPELNITHKETVFEIIGKTRPDLVIHAAAYTDVDGCARNPELAYKVNGLGTQNVALACQKFDVEMAHISSNEVFAGDKLDGYEEWMPLNPCNPYGRSKAAAEFHVRSLLSRYYIVRFSWLYAPGGRNFIHAILNRARETGQLRVVTDEVANPTYVNDLAAAIAQLIETHQYGTYHLPNNGACSRWEFANEILRLAGLDDVANTPILSSEFVRPSTPPPYCALNNIAGKALGIVVRPWQEALADYLREYA
ncbi:MAG: dTDP-4-dehydrorhamnose reductase [Ardenticatenaceae bacterium]|nr:dTDP-4-dehydrorhamnose reductase [Ardenticatenaceae bacterium]MCB9446236.1 dTDP-4-dehydrorhamnose reductase [Ardenticatenaceae bacterium]